MICSIGAALELIAAEPAGDACDEVGDLYCGLTAGIGESDIGQPVSAVIGSEGGGDVGNAFLGQCGLLVVYDGKGLRLGAPMMNCATESGQQRLHQRSQFGAVKI